MKSVDKLIRAIDRGKLVVTGHDLICAVNIHEARIEVKVYHDYEHVHFDICFEQHAIDINIEETDFVLLYQTSARNNGRVLGLEDLNIVLKLDLTEAAIDAIVFHYKSILLPATGFTDEQLSDIVSASESQHSNRQEVTA